MSDKTTCWRCNEVLEDLILPLSRREECKHCSADQHVCKMCEHFSANTVVQCNEERAEPPSDLTAANFCDYFALLQGSGIHVNAAQSDAKAQLDALFGSDEASAEDVVGGEPDARAEKHESAQSKAEAELKKLFGD
ncbi:MAG: hypothetical protein AB8B86_14765 [Pseudomonadales bacterium]